MLALGCRKVRSLLWSDDLGRESTLVLTWRALVDVPLEQTAEIWVGFGDAQRR